MGILSAVLFACIITLFPFQGINKNTVHGQRWDKLANRLEIGSTSPDDIQFFLYANPEDPNEYEELIFNDTRSVFGSRYGTNKSLILLCHGFMQDYTSQFPVVVRDAYLKANFGEKNNIVVVNWGSLANPLFDQGPDMLGFLVYESASGNVYTVGKRIQEFIVFLEQNGLLAPGGENVRMVGHSLGAHASGMAGHYYSAMGRGLINRITGTDPAKPGFEPQTEDLRLSPGSAKFVDVVHTNQGVLGYLGDLGHVDFRVNGGGPLQPQCGLTDLACSHNLAAHFFAASILSNAIVACPQGSANCTDLDQIVFGEFGSNSARGPYHLNMQVKSYK